jgi:hypothetical protein
MNAIAPIDHPAPEAPKLPLVRTLKVLAGITRWTWRVCSILLMLFAGSFILIGLSQRFRISTDPEDLALIAFGVVVFAGLILAWWHEGLGGLIILLAAGTATVIDMVRNWRATGHAGGGEDAAGFGVLALPLLMLLSWSLHTLCEPQTRPFTRRVALIAAPLLTVAIAFCVAALVHAPFNP